MIWLLVLSTLFIVLTVLLVGKLQIAVNLDGSKARVEFDYLFFNKEISKRGSEKEESVRKNEESSEKEGQAGKIIHVLRSGQDFILSLRKFFTSFVRYGEIPELKVEGELGTGDPYSTGTSYGIIQSVGGVVKFAVPIFELNVVPNFDRTVYEFSLRGRGRIRAGSLLFVLLVTIVYLPKRETWNLIRHR